MALRYDAYPAEAVLPDRTVLRGVRVMVTSTDRVLVWADVTGVAQVRYTALAVRHKRMPEPGAFWTERRLETVVDDGVFTTNPLRPSGCNCGGSHALANLTEADADRLDRHLDVTG